MILAFVGGVVAWVALFMSGVKDPLIPSLLAAVAVPVAVPGLEYMWNFVDARRLWLREKYIEHTQLMAQYGVGTCPVIVELDGPVSWRLSKDPPHARANVTVGSKGKQAACLYFSLIVPLKHEIEGQRTDVFPAMTGEGPRVFRITSSTSGSVKWPLELSGTRITLDDLDPT